MKLVISSNPRLLHIVRGVIRYCAQAAGFPESDADCLAMAIDEAATNVIRHAYDNRSDARLSLELLPFPDRIEFVLEDEGRKVPPEVIRPRPLEDVRPGGLGTYFIRCFMDESSYDADFTGGNRLRMVKYLPRKVTSSDESRSQKRR
ncbi:MAG: ATP-binding protein [Acidobacteria bacterium]|nr:ATP-binding protein [Acidobacteriota bacterium]MBI1984062.1 ATP-binding protein [Acidobacteriota bacterium]